MTDRPAVADLSEQPELAEELPVDIERIRDVLGTHPVRLAVLFGSQVAGTTDDRSDIDIAIELDADIGRPGDTTLAILTDLSVALDRNDLDIGLVDDVAPRVGRAAFTHGVLLCGSPERATTLRDRFEAAAKRDQSNRSLRERLDETLERVDRHVESEA
jgi:predicted nucleotidyltransferase